MTIEEKNDIEKAFDNYMKKELFAASNAYRKEHGLPILTEDEVNEIMNFQISEDDETL
jgi:hypothetical protein